MDNLAYQEQPWDELIDGKIVAMSPRPTYNHNVVADNITFIFKDYLRGKTCRAYGDGMDVILNEKNRFVPDSMIVCNHDIIQRDGIHGAPDLVVEVLSPSTASRDRGYKMKRYARAGVREYWLVDPMSRSIEVYLPENGKFEFQQFYGIFPDYELSKMTEQEKTQIITKFKVSILPDIEIDLERVFDGMIK